MKPSSPDALNQGRVVVQFGQHCLAEDPNGRLIRCTIPRRLNPVCGDRVHWQEAKDGVAGTLTDIQPRRNELRRHDIRDQQRTLAANLDLMLVVCAAQPAPELALIDRYLAASELLKLGAIIVFNKADLLDAAAQQSWDKELASFSELGYPVIYASSKDGRGITTLHTALANRAGIVLGQSGVGKSTLVKALIPDLEVRTQMLSEASGAGMHTTTTTRLYPLPRQSGCIMDSPGVRDFRLWPLRAPEVAQAFREVRALADQCRFNDCRHLREPDCAVLAAVENGTVSKRRHTSYVQLMDWMKAD